MATYQEKDWQCSYLRTKDDFEIDLVIDRPGQKRTFVEIKSTRNIQWKKFTGLKVFLKEHGAEAETFGLSQDPKEFISDGMVFLPWEKGIIELGL